MAQLLRGALESDGIPTIVEGEDLFSLQGAGVPAGASVEYRVSIVDDEQLPRAVIFVKQWLEDRHSAGSGGPWLCEACGERHEPQFHSCWNCGAETG